MRSPRVTVGRLMIVVALVGVAFAWERGRGRYAQCMAMVELYESMIFGTESRIRESELKASSLLEKAGELRVKIKAYAGRSDAEAVNKVQLLIHRADHLEELAGPHLRAEASEKANLAHETKMAADYRRAAYRYWVKMPPDTSYKGPPLLPHDYRRRPMGNGIPASAQLSP